VTADGARFLYAVRCNFAGTRAEEQAWNAWYDGQKLGQMLLLPMFVSVQRLVATGLDRRRKYIALWLVTSPGALTTEAYRAQWGFAEWAPRITDWSRDLYAAPAAIDSVLDVGGSDALYLASFDGLTLETALSRLGDQRGDAVWLEAIGLDRHAPVLGVKKVRRRAPHPAPSPIPGLNESLFEPIGHRLSANPRTA
jgi:hypothetical protein